MNNVKFANAEANLGDQASLNHEMSSESNEKLSQLSNGLYQFRSDMSALNLIDQIDKCLDQAQSLAVFMMDENFGQYSPAIISAYGETIMDRVIEGRMLANKIWEKYKAASKEYV